MFFSQNVLPLSPHGSITSFAFQRHWKYVDSKLLTLALHASRGLVCARPPNREAKSFRQECRTSIVTKRDGNDEQHWFADSPRRRLATTSRTHLVCVQWQRHACCLSRVSCVLSNPSHNSAGLFSICRADLLLLLWPVFFVAAASQSPHLKIRNFRKSVSKGLTRAVRQKNAADTGEAKPEWDSFDEDPGEQVRERVWYYRKHKTHVRFARLVPMHISPPAAVDHKERTT